MGACFLPTICLWKWERHVALVSVDCARTHVTELGHHSVHNRLRNKPHFFSLFVSLIQATKFPSLINKINHDQNQPFYFSPNYHIDGEFQRFRYRVDDLGQRNVKLEEKGKPKEGRICGLCGVGSDETSDVKVELERFYPIITIVFRTAKPRGSHFWRGNTPNLVSCCICWRVFVLTWCWGPREFHLPNQITKTACHLEIFHYAASPKGKPYMTDVIRERCSKDLGLHWVEFFHYWSFI